MRGLVSFLKTSFRHERIKLACQRFYDHNITQMLISVLLLANFVISILQSELDVESNNELAARFDTIEMTFSFLYVGELLLNMYARSLRL